MSVKRAPSAPPAIPGYDFRQLLGSGGFADVFLYQQAMPSRLVAVKVLLPNVVDGNLIADFHREANLMAQLSTHPSIVTVYGAAVTEDARPYIAMEYCSRPNLGVRYKRDRFTVPEVLTLGVQIAGAVETAHRAGVLHRDIKPANILVTAYNRPALTDFGIATSAGDAGDGSGMSIPWSPPEAFAEPPTSSRESDVFSLAATLYTLLAGRTPFELPGGGNTSLDIITRIQRGEIAPLLRSDVPSSLQLALQAAMDPDASRRHPSAIAFGRALQQVESEMALPVTPLDVLDEGVEAEEVEEEDGGATRIRGVVTIHPDLPTHASRPRFDAQHTVSVLDDHTVKRQPGTVLPPAPGSADSAHPEAAPRRAAAARSSSKRVIGVVVVGVMAAVAVGAGIWAAVSGGGAEPQPGDPTASVAAPQQPPPAPIALEGELDGDDVTFTWVNPQPMDGDRFRYRAERSDGSPLTGTVDAETLTIPRDASGTTCLNVAVMRVSQLTSDYAEGCVDG